MNPQIMSKLQSKIEADKAAYFAAGGTITLIETALSKMTDTWDHYSKPDEKPLWVETDRAAAMLDITRPSLSQLACRHEKNGTPCPEYKWVGRMRMWLVTSVIAFKNRRRRIKARAEGTCANSVAVRPRKSV